VSEVQEHLLVIQDKDRRIAKMAQESEDVPARKDMIRTRLEDHQNALEAVQKDNKKLTAKQKEIEGAIVALHEKGNKYKAQQISVKTNKEYSALESEIKAVAKMVGDREEDQLKVMEQIDALNVVIAEKEKDLKDEESDVDSDLKALDERFSNIEAQLNKMKDDRKGLAEAIDGTWLRQYERIYQNKKDYGMVGVENGTCGGCFMKVTPQTVHNARRGTEMASCEYCGRLLYWKC
jgi:predicted  nucleic acid-binding Zn-ribbon protein